VKPREVLFIAVVSLVMGGIFGMLGGIVGFLGGTILTFAIVFAIYFWWQNRSKSKEEKSDRAVVRSAAEDQKRRTAEAQPGDGSSGAGADPLLEEDIIDEFSREFMISKEKAEALYGSGYTRWVDFEEAIPQDLMLVPGINPTVARKIIRTVHSRDLK